MKILMVVDCLSLLCAIIDYMLFILYLIFFPPLSLGEEPGLIWKFDENEEEEEEDEDDDGEEEEEEEGEDNDYSDDNIVDEDAVEDDGEDEEFNSMLKGKGI